MCEKMVSRLSRHIRETHQLKHACYRCSTCGWSSLRRCDVAWHCTSARHGTVEQAHCAEGFVSLRRCTCGFVGLDLQWAATSFPSRRHLRSRRHHRYRMIVPLDDPAIVRITPVLPVLDPVLDRLFDECVTTIVEFLESEHDSELDCDVPTIVIN